MDIKVVCRRRISRFLITGVIGLAASLPVQGQGSPLSLNQAGEALPTETTLTAQERAMVAWVDERKQSIITELSAHVDINTGTANIEGIDRYRTVLEQELAALGFTTETHSSVPIDVLTCEGGQVLVADHLTGVIRGGDGPRVLINGHMDTVFSATDEFQSLQISDDGVLKGPGVADMKGGIVVMLNALRALSDQGLLEGSNLTVLFNSDEEIGSPTSRKLIENEARSSRMAYVLEAGGMSNDIVAGRKGNLSLNITVTGKAGHAAFAGRDKASAILEMAHKTLAIEAMNQPEIGISANVGTITGGIGSNTVPDRVAAGVDFRFLTQRDEAGVKTRIQEILSFHTVPHTRSEMSVLSGRPPMPQTRGNMELYEKIESLAHELGNPVRAELRQGVSDANFISQQGTPVIDGLGPMGEKDHSEDEYIQRASLWERTILFGNILAEI